jgi:TRAP-type transport system small permease protein
MGKLKNLLESIDKTILTALKFITITILSVLAVIVTAGIIVRYFGKYLQVFFPTASFSLHWSDEIVEMLLVALVFYGSAALWISKGHFSAGDWISKLIKSGRIKRIYRMLLELTVLTFVGLFLYYSFNLFMAAQDVTNALAIPKKVLYSCMPVSAVIMVFYSVKNVIIELIGVIKPEAGEEPVNDEK